MKIIYITKLNKSMANGVTVSILQLLNTLCEYADIYWLDLNNNEFEINSKINVIKTIDEMPDKIDLAVFEDPFNTLKFCKIAKMLKKKNIPYILVPHGCFNKKALKRKKIKKYIAIKTVLKSFLNHSVAVQYLTENEKKNSICFNRNIIIPNGIIKNSYYNEAKRIRDIIYIGRKDIDHKGLDLLIEACSIIQDILREEKCKIEIYGPTNNLVDENTINELIEQYNISDIITNKGPLFGQEKEKALCNADAFIQTSRYEGFPMSLLEAFSYGLPVLITEGTNLSEIVYENNAGFISKTNAEDIANMILEAIRCNNIELQKKNAKKLSEIYSWDSICEQTIKIYSNLIQEVSNER